MVFLHKIFISFYFKVKIILRCDKRIKKTKRRVYIYRSKIIKGELEINKGKRHGKTLHKIKWPNSLKIVPSGVANCRNLPFGGRATRDSRDACSMKGIRAESPPTFI